jgi:membrane protease YdiL (CAAX protease family)
LYEEKEEPVEEQTGARAPTFSLGLYLVIVFGLSWPFQIAANIWAAQSPTLLYVLVAVSMVMVTVGTFISGRFIFRDSFSDAGWRWGKPKHYLAIIGLVVLTFVVPTLVDLALGAVNVPDDANIGAWLGHMLGMTLVALIPGFGEEFGWRGYMLPRLARRLSARKAVTLHGVIWWAWHLPMLVGTGIYTGIALAENLGMSPALAAAVYAIFLVILGAIPTIMHGIVFGYIWSRSRSLAVVTVYHALYDTVRNSFMEMPGFGPVTGVWLQLVFVIFGVIFLWKGNWDTLEQMGLSVQESPGEIQEPGGLMAGA